MSSDNDPIHSYRWRKLSQEIRARDNYECYMCGEHATSVDHLKPSSKYPELFWDPDNLRACCTMHNSSKGNREVLEQRKPWQDTHWFESSTKELARAQAGADQ